MDYAIRSSDKEFLLIIDSDVSLKKPLIDEMFLNFSGYCVGKRIIINSSGYESWQKTNTGDRNFIYDYIHPYCMLIKKSEYVKYRPFKKHGAPCIDNMIDIHNNKKQIELSHFNIEDYVNLEIRGTRKIWGIGL